MNLPRMRMPNLDSDRAWSILTGVALPMIALGVGALLAKPLGRLTPEAFAVATVLRCGISRFPRAGAENWTRTARSAGLPSSGGHASPTQPNW